MAIYFTLELDTQAPEVTWGIPIGGAPGQLLTIPYTINEPEIVSATLVDSAGRIFPLTVGATELTGTMPADQYAGNAEVRAVVRDSVWNEGIETLAIVLQGQEFAIENQGGGVSREFTQIGGPAFVVDTDRFDGLVTATKTYVERVPAQVSGRRRVVVEANTFSGTVSAARRDILRFSGQRDGNVTLAQIRREDDELMMMFL